jgi:hypothetical protein
MKHFGDLSLLTLPWSVFCQVFHGWGRGGDTRGGLGADNLLLGAMFICSGLFDELKLQKKSTWEISFLGGFMFYDLWQVVANMRGSSPEEVAERILNHTNFPGLQVYHHICLRRFFWKVINPLISPGEELI